MAASNAIVPTTRMPKSRSDRHLFSTSDDNAMMRQILATHAPDGREFDVKPVLNIIEDVMHRAAPTIPGMTPHVYIILSLHNILKLMYNGSFA